MHWVKAVAPRDFFCRPWSREEVFQLPPPKSTKDKAIAGSVDGIEFKRSRGRARTENMTRRMHKNSSAPAFRFEQIAPRRCYDVGGRL